MDSISIDDIKSAPWNTRGEIKPESVAELAASIGEQGLINPVTLWESDGGVWLCVAGNRRLVALRATGVKQLVEGSDFTRFVGSEDEAKMVTVTENLQREDVGPLEEAALVKECLDGGMTAEAIAAKTGRPTSWVNRRRKLIALDEAWKARTDLTVDALEHIAAYSPEIQKKVAKAYTGNSHTWKDLAYHFDRESVDLDTSKFDTSACHGCVKRTGVEADLFGVTDGKLGRCLDCKCFEAKRNAYEEELIAEATKGATEVVRVHYAWELPGKDESSAKKTKKHPCAYVHVYNGDVEVRWGESAKAKKEREDAKRAEAEKEREARKAETAREDGIVKCLNNAFEDGGDRAPEVMKKVRSELAHFNAFPEAAKEMVARAVFDDLNSWKYCGDSWASYLRAYPWIAEFAGVSQEDAKYITDKYPAANEGEED